jgi:COP9 signalosome complex subunit 2
MFCNLEPVSIHPIHNAQLIRELYAVTEASASGEDQSQKGTQLLEIYALEIQMHNEMRNYKKLKVGVLSRSVTTRLGMTLSLQEIYNASNSIRSAIPHPRIMGIIKECGGKMWMGERWYSHLLLEIGFVESLIIDQWNRASEDFFESFRNYDEAGLPQRIQVLKYLVLANMLTGSEVNPFDSQETKPWVWYSFYAPIYHYIWREQVQE